MMRSLRLVAACVGIVALGVALATTAAFAGYAGRLDRDGVQQFMADPDRTAVVSVLAAWCAPCREEIPALNALYGEFAERGIEVVGMSLDFSEQDLHSMLRQTGAAFPVYWVGEGGMAALGVTKIPVLIFVRNGREVQRLTGLRGLAELRTRFENLLGPDGEADGGPGDGPDAVPDSGDGARD